MQDCIFCKIIGGELPSYKVYEDGDYLAFLDIEPVSNGHILVIPKKHYRWTWNVPDFGEYWEIAKRVTMATLKALSAERVHYITLGEAVPHAHIHIIPRYKNDGLGSLPDWTKTKKFSNSEMIEIVDTIRKNI